jgi:hypothetical protein
MSNLVVMTVGYRSARARAELAQQARARAAVEGKAAGVNQIGCVDTVEARMLDVWWVQGCCCVTKVYVMFGAMRPA